MWQFADSEQMISSDLVIPLAKSFAKYIVDVCGDFARLIECRRCLGNKVEIVSFDLDIGVPQYPVYPINATETVSVWFLADNGSAPLIVVARPDFPDTPHQILVPEGCPSLLCVDDRPWQDIRNGYTASELMARIGIWFAKACEGELHGDDQPFDPFFSYDGAHEVIVGKDAEDAMTISEKLNIWATDERARFLRVTAARSDRQGVDCLHLHVVHVNIEPQAMLRIKRAPKNLRQLGLLLQDRGVDLASALQNSIADWLTVGKMDDDKKWLFCILVTMPQIHPRTGQIGALRPMAFLCEKSPGEIGVALGTLQRNASDKASRIRYVRMIGADPSLDELGDIAVQVAPVHQELGADGAAELAGASALDQRRVVMIGAGSLGSSLAESLVREGLFRWTIVDIDDFLPHNIARHTLTRLDFGRPKAPLLAARIGFIRQDALPVPISENVLSSVLSNQLTTALDEADIILDASASVSVSRWLSDRPGDARRICAFFTPDGRSAILMIEAADRSVNLRDLEAAYFREVLTNPYLADHIRPGQQMRYTGACRALTSKIPASAVAVLAGLIAMGISAHASERDALLKIWMIGNEASIGCVDVRTSVIKKDIFDWIVVLPEGLQGELVSRRTDALPNETGGSLMGIIDYEAKHIALVHTLAPPPDSMGTPSGFVRGTRGLRRRLEEAQQRSGGQVRYVGEWHSHPRGVSASPSVTDIAQIKDLSVMLDVDDLPAVSMIIGENDTQLIIGKISDE